MDSEMSLNFPAESGATSLSLPFNPLSVHSSRKRRVHSKFLHLLVATASMIVCHVSGFNKPEFGRRRCTSTKSTTLLLSSSFKTIQEPTAPPSAAVRRQRTRTKKPTASSSSVLQPIQPLTSISAERRRKALKAMDRNKVDSSLQGVDAQMLELLSEQFLYPMANDNNNNKKQQQQQQVGTSKDPRSRPRGRPEFVPGAMNFETMIKFRERREVMDLARNAAAANANSVPVMPPSFAGLEKSRFGNDYVDTTIESNFISSGNHAITTEEIKKQRPIKGSSTTASTTGESVQDKPQLKLVSQDGEVEKETKKRKRVVKNLPEPRIRSDEIEQPATLSPLPKTGNGKAVSKSSRTNISSNHNINLNLQKYYRTELLSPEEEYSLGMKTQFLMKCEQVHEGMSAFHMRIPTFEEWAFACGFKDPDTTFVPTEADEQLRPAGCETMFDEIDPHMFVGNGPASAAGPGRGRGRVKRAPPLKLGNFFDDTSVRFQKEGAGGASNVKEKLQPMNQGTITDFVEMLMDCKAAKQRMVQCNMRLVISIARKYSNVGVNLQDLVQEGSLGLTRAAEKFEPTKGFKFSTYASWWIQQAVFRSIAYHSRTIRLPVHVHNMLNRVRKVRNALERDLGRKPSNEEMAAQLDMSVKKYNKMLRLTRRSISLELPKYQSNPKDLGHESEDLIGDTIDSSSVVNDDNPEKRVDRGLFHEDLKDMLRILDEDERRVICYRYGLADGLTRTVTAVAAQMKQSKAWVRSQECRALRKLRRPWYEKKLKEHQDALTS